MSEKFKGCFSKAEIILWLSSAMLIVVSFCIFDGKGFGTLSASLIGVTAIIFNAKGNPFGQLLMVIFSIIYGVISFSFSYYGEMITYLGMTMPMAVFALISWLKNPYNGNRSEVRVNSVGKKEVLLMSVAAIVYLTFRRSPAFSLAYAANDIVLIILWSLASMEDPRYISVTVCFAAFLANDIYAFISWQKMKKRQLQSSAQTTV